MHTRQDVWLHDAIRLLAAEHRLGQSDQLRFTPTLIAIMRSQRDQNCATRVFELSHDKHYSGFSVVGDKRLAIARKGDRPQAKTKAEWMAQVFKQTRRRHVLGFNPPRGGPFFYSRTRLLLGRFRDPWYYLLEPIYWLPNPDQVGRFQRVRVPQGFVTDLATIPWELWSVLRPDGEYAYAAIVHDYLYWTQTRTRLMSDEILRSSMEDFHVDRLKIQAIYRGVRAFGERYWNENAWLKANVSGEF